MGKFNGIMKTAIAATSLVAILSATACGDDDDSGDGSSGGTAGKGGSSGKGGTAGKGGSGGSDNEGGSDATGAGGTEGDAEGGSGGEGEPVEESLYLVPTYVLGAGDTSQTYLNLTTSFDADTVIDATSGYEIQGDAFPFVHEGVIYLTDPLAPVITKFTVNEDNELVKGDEVSFAGVGLSGPPSQVYIVNSEKAYVFDIDGLRAIIWNPSDMSLTGEEVDLSDLEYEDHAPWMSTEPFNLRVRGNHIYIPVDWADVYDSGVLIIDTNEDEVVDVLRDPRCGGGGASAELGGDLYFFPSAANTLTFHNLAETPAPSCALRINEGEDEFDTEFTLDLTEITGGLGAQGGIPVGDSLYISAIDPQRFAERQSNFDPFWGFWHYELGADEATQLSSFPWWQGAMYYFDLGGRIIVPVFEGGTGDSSEWKSTFYEMTPDGEPAELFAINASWGTIAKLK